MKYKKKERRKQYVNEMSKIYRIDINFSVSIMVLFTPPIHSKLVVFYMFYTQKNGTPDQFIRNKCIEQRTKNKMQSWNSIQKLELEHKKKCNVKV